MWDRCHIESLDADQVSVFVACAVDDEWNPGDDPLAGLGDDMGVAYDGTDVVHGYGDEGDEAEEQEQDLQYQDQEEEAYYDDAEGTVELEVRRTASIADTDAVTVCALNPPVERERIASSYG